LKIHLRFRGSFLRFHIMADSSDLLEPAGRRPVRNWSKPNSITLSWSQTGSKLVADLLVLARAIAASKFQLAAGLRPASDVSATRIA